MPVKIAVTFKSINTGRHKTWAMPSMNSWKLADAVSHRARILYATHVFWEDIGSNYHASREYEVDSKLDMASFAGDVGEYKQAQRRALTPKPVEQPRIVPREIDTIRHHLKIATARGHKDYAARLRQKLVTLTGNQTEEI